MLVKKKLTEQTLEDPIVSVDFKDSSKKKVEDLEVKDAQLIFIQFGMNLSRRSELKIYIFLLKYFG